MEFKIGDRVKCICGGPKCNGPASIADFSKDTFNDALVVFDQGSQEIIPTELLININYYNTKLGKILYK